MDPYNSLKCKVELHTHFDGALRPQTVMDLARSKGIELPADNIEQLKRFITCADVEKKSLTMFLKVFDLLNSVLRGDPDALRRCAFEFCEDQARQGVLYTEVRYAPQLMSGKIPVATEDAASPSLTNDEVIQILLDAFEEGSKRYGIKVRSILALIRPKPEWAAETVELCKKYFGKGVVGLDVAGDEALFPVKANDEFVKAFQEAKKFGIHRTAHAGEAGPAQNIREVKANLIAIYQTLTKQYSCSITATAKSLDWLSAERIGHGYHLVEDEELFNRVKREGVHLEVCPTSSLLTGSVVNFANHPAKRFINEGLNFSINSDDSICCNSDVANEYKVVYNEWGFDFPILARAALNAARSSFLPEDEKKQLVKELEVAYGIQ